MAVLFKVPRISRGTFPFREVSMKKTVVALVSLMLMAACAVQPVLADEPTAEQVTVDKAQLALKAFMEDPDMEWMHNGLKNAEGVLIIPTLVKVGLIFGGSGGKGVFFARDTKTGQWKGPAFYNLGSVTFGLQLGGEAAQVAILAMTDNAVKALLSPSFRLGGDFGVAAGPAGVGTSGAASLPAAPFISFSRAKGIYAGLTLEGAVLNTDDDANQAFYGRPVKVEDILLTGEASTDKAAGLRDAIAAAGK